MEFTSVYVLLIFLVEICVARVHKEILTEVLFVISGSRNFGGSPDKAFNSVINDTIIKLANKTKDGQTSFCIIWIEPGLAHDRWTPIHYRAVSVSMLQQSLNIYFQNSHVTTSNRMKLEGLVEHSLKKRFNIQNHKSVKVVILLIHQEVSVEEIRKMLTYKSCQRVIIVVVFFQNKAVGCLSKGMEKGVKTAKMFLPYGLAFCGLDKEFIGKVGTDLPKAITKHRVSMPNCVKPVILSNFTNMTNGNYTCEGFFCPIYLGTSFLVIVLIILIVVLIVYHIRQSMEAPKPQQTFGIQSMISQHQRDLLLSYANTMNQNQFFRSQQPGPSAQNLAVPPSSEILRSSSTDHLNNSGHATTNKRKTSKSRSASSSDRRRSTAGTPSHAPTYRQHTAGGVSKPHKTTSPPKDHVRASSGSKGTAGSKGASTGAKMAKRRASVAVIKLPTVSTRPPAGNRRKSVMM